MKKRFLLIVSIAVFVIASLNANKIEVASGGDIGAAVSSAVDGDTIVLDNGGIYTVGTFNIDVKLTIMAEEGYTSRPEVTAAGPRFNGAKGVGINLIGIEFISDGDDYFINYDAADSVNFIRLNDVVVHGYGRCAIRADQDGSYLDTLIIENSHFYDFDDNGWRLLYIRDDRTPMKLFKAVNSTFDGFNETFLQANSSAVKEVIIDHCTINGKVGAGDSNPLFNIDGAIGSKLKITNTLITNIEGTGDCFNLGGDMADTIMNSRFYFDETSVDTANAWDLKENFIKEDPLYANVADGNLTLPRGSSLLTAGTDGGVIGDPRWVPEPLPDGVIAWWKLDETSGSEANDEVGTSDGIYQNTGDSLWVDGVDGGAVDFQKGVDSAYIEVAHNDIVDFDSTESFTISALVNIETANHANDINIAFKGATGITTEGGEGKWYTLAFKSNELRIAVDDNVNKTQLGVDVSSLLPSGKWVHVVGVRDLTKDSVYVYLHGEEVGRMYDVTTNDISSTLPLIIGNNQDMNNQFKGMVDDLRMYDKALSAQEISELFDYYDIALSSNADLSDLQVDGTTVEGFDPATLSYDVELPAGTTIVPFVSGTASDAAASVTIADASSLPGTTTVTVTAENGTSVDYMVNFTLPALSNDADLTGITLGPDVDLSPAFSADVTSYTAELPEGTASVTVSVTKSDDNATVTGDGDIDVSSGSGTATIVVTAEDDTEKTYTIEFTVAETVGISPISGNSKIDAYYNRAANELIIVEGVEHASTIEIYDIHGKQIGVIDSQISNVVHLNSYNLMNNNVYCIRITDKTNNAQSLIKIVK